jgi:uncharacterized protein YlxW (UPF0749 family)
MADDPYPAPDDLSPAEVPPAEVPPTGVPPEQRFGLSWLESLGKQSLDPGYAEAADRRRSGHAQRTSRSAVLAWSVAAVVIAGVVLGVAVRSQQANASSTAKARDGVVADVTRAQQREQTLEASAAALGEQIRSRQQALGNEGPWQTIAALQAQGGMSAVAGPGLRVVIDGGDRSAGNPAVILDRDVQVLVNGLWAAGSEAISVGGLRLRVTSAIRQAGGAILVDNKPTFWPITIEAIGDPNAMYLAFAETTGYGRFTAFADNYGIRFDVSAQQRLALPGGAEPELRYALPGTDRSTPGIAKPTGPTR